MDGPASNYRFRNRIEIDESSIDELGHVSNLVYIEWALAIAKAHSAAVGYDPARYVEMGMAFVVKRHEIDYHRPVMLGQTVECSTWVDSWRSASSVRRTEIRIVEETVEETVEGAVGATPEGPLAAAMSTQWVFAALPSGRPKRIPQELRQAYDDYVG